MSDFSPSVQAAKKALGSRYLIETKDHPAGAKGVAFSLDEVAARVRRGKDDPRVRSWAIRAVKDADVGGPNRTVAQAEAILAALRKATVYVQDPLNTEFIQAAHETLCLDDKGLCFKGGDCDDLCVAFFSACLSIGIPVQIIGQSFKEGEPPSHVMGAIQDTGSGSWLKVDPSTDKPVGEYVFAVKEWVIDPLDVNDKTTAGLSGGTFVGVGALGTLGDVPADAVTQNVVVQQIQAALFDLKSSVTGLSAALDQIAQVTKVTGFDPEPTNPITSIAQFQSGIWTAAMDKIARDFLSQGLFQVSIGQDALNGVRTIYLDAKNSLAIGRLPTDQYVWTALSIGGALVLAIANPAGTILGAITAAVGEFLTPAQLQSDETSGTVQGLGAVPIVLIVGVTAAVTAIAVLEVIAVWAITKRLSDTITTIAQEKSMQAIIAFTRECLAAGTCTADQAAAILKDQRQKLNEAAKDRAADDPFSSALDKAASVLKWVAIGGLVVVGVTVAYPVVKELSESAAGALKSKRLAKEHT